MGVRRMGHEGFHAQDPQLLLEHLVAACWRAGRRLEREAADEASPAAVRRCAIELSLLAEACGVTVPRDVHQVDDDGLVDVLSAYQRAIRAPLPRAIQTVLRDHLARLEGCVAPAASSDRRAPRTSGRALAAA